MVHSQTHRPRSLTAVAGRGAAGHKPLRPVVHRALDLTAVEQIAESSRWRELAACADEDPELFFPTGSSGPAQRQEQQAKAVCARCPVLARCRQDALESRDVHGVRGGMTEGERLAILRAARKAAAKKAGATQTSATKTPARTTARSRRSASAPARPRQSA